MLYNIHTHTPTLDPATPEIESVYFGQPEPGRSPMQSFGLHPWYLAGPDLVAAKAWLYEHAARPETRAIGEAGLDKLTATPRSLQLEAFHICFEASEAFRKPLILHCVRAFDDILALKKQWKPAQPWIFHGFEKNPETARRLLDAGCFLSFGAALFRPNSHTPDALRQTPADRFFLETDDSDHAIEAVYERAGTIRDMAPADLQVQVQQNFESVFGRV